MAGRGIRNSSPSATPCRCAMAAAAFSSGTPGPSAGLRSRARCSQLNAPTRRSIWHDPPSRKNPWLPPATSTGVKLATIGTTACAPSHSLVQSVDRRDRQSAADIRRRLYHPDLGGMGERWAERVERAGKLGFENQDTEDHRHSERDADHAEQCPAPVGDQRCEVDAPKRHPPGAQALHHRSAMGTATSTARHVRRRGVTRGSRSMLRPRRGSP